MKWMRLVPIIFFIMIATLMWRGLYLNAREVPSPLIGKELPPLNMPTLLGTQNLTNKDFQGHVTLLNIWASWCYACALEHELLLQIANDEKVIIYGINYKDQTSDAIQLLKDKGDPYKIVGLDPDGDVSMDLGVYGTPETYVIDKKGIVRYKQTGSLSQEKWEGVLKPLVEELNK